MMMKLPPRFELGAVDLFQCFKVQSVDQLHHRSRFYAILALPRTHHEEVLHTCPIIQIVI